VHAVLGIVTHQVGVTSSVGEARGHGCEQAVRVACRYEELLGWLNQDAGRRGWSLINVFTRAGCSRPARTGDPRRRSRSQHACTRRHHVAGPRRDEGAGLRWPQRVAGRHDEHIGTTMTTAPPACTRTSSPRLPNLASRSSHRVAISLRSVALNRRPDLSGRPTTSQSSKPDQPRVAPVTAAALRDLSPDRQPDVAGRDVLD
jgi:hypothetical protein